MRGGSHTQAAYYDYQFNQYLAFPLVGSLFVWYLTRMEAVVSHITAFRWLVRNANPHMQLPRKCRACKLPHAAPHEADARQLLHSLGLPDEKAHLLIAKPSGRRVTRNIETHLWTSPLPPGSFLPIEAAGCDYPVFVASPELVFLQLAATRPIEEAIYFGFALCSSYCITDAAARGIVLRGDGDKPLTTPNKIAAFLAKVEPAHGSARARKALRYVRPNSYSPMESALAMSLGMPLRLGGFNFSDIELNPTLTIRTGTDAYGDPRFSVRRPDLLIRSKGRTGEIRQVAIDYDSFAFHAERENLRKDALRRNELTLYPGMTHLVATTAQVNDFGQFVHLAEQVRKALGKRSEPIRKAHMPESEFKKLQEDVRRRQFNLWAKIVRMSTFRQEE